MHALTVQIVRFVDVRQPGWVECEFADAEGQRHLIVDKVPIFTVEDLDSESEYPRPGGVPCEILERFQDENKQELVRVSTAKPDGIETTERKYEFTVPANLITFIDD